MSLFATMDVAGMSLDAQSTRLNTIASNLANANVVKSSEAEVYRARYPVFAAAMSAVRGEGGGVRVERILQSELPALREFVPGHPLADDEGYIYRPDINQVDEMANMMAASRSYQNSIQAMETTKQLALRTLTLGR